MVNLRWFGIAILLIILLRIDKKELILNVYNLKFTYLLLAMGLTIPQVVIKSYRWRLLLRLQNIAYSMKDSFLVYFASIYVGIISPGRLGEFLKVLYLRNDKGISVTQALPNVIIDRLFDLYLLVCLGLFGVWKFNIFGKISPISMATVSLFFFSPLFLLNKKLAIKTTNILYKILAFKKLKELVGKHVDDFYEEIGKFNNSKIFFAIFLTIISYTLFFAQCYLVALALHIKLDILTIILFMSISNLISFIPVSIAGLGTRDAALIYLFGRVGLNVETAVIFASFIFIVCFVMGGLMGFIAWLLKPLSLRKEQVLIQQHCNCKHNTGDGNEET